MPSADIIREDFNKLKEEFFQYNITEYVSKMKKSGFIHKTTKDGIAILEGDFASYKNCTVYKFRS